MKDIKLAMAFHCHQPVFNLEGEIERAYLQAYLPLLSTLADFPGIKATFHFSGSILEWLEKRHPEFIGMLKRLVEEGRIEIIGGAYSEPIMALIPESDRAGQLRMNLDIIERALGVKPSGAWIAERVWEPGMADTLTRAGAAYTILDDHHLLRAGLEEKHLFKPCRTRGREGDITLFPSMSRLRYYMPFRACGAVLDYMERTAESCPWEKACFFFADDAEKFGAWPRTYAWVHRKGWLRNFFALLERRSERIKTLTYSDILETTEPVEVREVPESSYAEMMAWSGGAFKNFLSKYTEADRMHKRMVGVSDSIIAAESEGPPSEGPASLGEAKKELFKAQSGCAYWHGTFGGLYLPHLRSGVYSHLIRAEKMLDSATDGETAGVRAVERDLDGARAETVIRNRFLDVFVRSSGGGVVTEIDLKPRELNLINSMTRVREGYHKKLQGNYFIRANRARKAALRGEMPDIHDVLGVAERGLKKELFYDDYGRNSFITHVFRHSIPWGQMRSLHVSHEGFLKGVYSSRTETGPGSVTRALSRRDRIYVGDGRPLDIEVVKKITVPDRSEVVFDHSVSEHSGVEEQLRYAVEFNFLVRDRSLGTKPRLMRADSLSVRDVYTDVQLELGLDSERDVLVYPVYTVNETESGLKKVHQGTSILIGGELRPVSGGAPGDMSLRLKVR